MASLKEKFKSGLLWQGLERLMSQGIAFLVMILLARLLSPEEFGSIAIVMVFIAFCDVLVQSGFGMALVQKKELHPDDCTSVFFINLATSLAVYAAIWFGAPLIARIYNDEQLILILRVIGVVPILHGVTIVNFAMLNKYMLFKKIFFIRLSSAVAASAVSIWMAYGGKGVWALVVQQIVLAGVGSACAILMYPYKFAFRIRWQSVRETFGFGWKILCSGILNSGFDNIYPLLWGTLFSKQALGYFDRGNYFPRGGAAIASSILGNISFPAFSSIQSDPEKIRQVLKKGLFMSALVMTFSLGLLASISPYFVKIFLTDKWLPCVIFMQLACLQFVFRPLSVLNLNVITALGRSDLFLILEVLKKIVIVVVVVLTYKFGPVVMASGICVTSVLCFTINAWPNAKLIRFGWWSQVWTIAPTIIIAAVAFFFTNWLMACFAGGHRCVLLVVAAVSFCTVYFVLSICLCRQRLMDIFKFARK